MKRLVIVLFALHLVMLATATAHSADGRIVLMWQVQKKVTDSDLAFLRSLGINTIQSFEFSFWSDSEIQAYLDKANKNSLKVIANLGRFIKASKSDVSIDEAGLANFMNTWKAHPAIFAWHSFDEPSNQRIGTDTQARVYKMIKKIDAARPVFLSWNGNNLDDYDCCFPTGAFDILGIQKYVNNDITWTQTNLMKFTSQHNRSGKSVVITLRAFNGTLPVRWKNLSSDSLETQYAYFFKQNTISNSIGFYGWELKPNMGIFQDENIKAQFINFMKNHH